MPKEYAVLTGDIVKSRKINTHFSTRETTQQAVAKFLKNCGGIQFSNIYTTLRGCIDQLQPLEVVNNL